jgi:hypothetical protein
LLILSSSGECADLGSLPILQISDGGELSDAAHFLVRPELGRPDADMPHKPNDWRRALGLCSSRGVTWRAIWCLPAVSMNIAIRTKEQERNHPLLFRLADIVRSPTLPSHNTSV